MDRFSPWFLIKSERYALVLASILICWNKNITRGSLWSTYCLAYAFWLQFYTPVQIQTSAGFDWMIRFLFVSLCFLTVTQKIQEVYRRDVTLQCCCYWDLPMTTRALWMVKYGTGHLGLFPGGDSNSKRAPWLFRVYRGLYYPVI